MHVMTWHEVMCSPDGTEVQPQHEHPLCCKSGANKLTIDADVRHSFAAVTVDAAQRAHFAVAALFRWEIELHIVSKGHSNRI